MFYRELVQFDPIEDVVQLLAADEKVTAQHHVQTYVISDRMADQLINIVIPQLQFRSPQNNKGMLVVGNYGTGKSHLMSVLAAVAEHGDLAEKLPNPDVREAAAQIAGKFKVWRVELGGVTGGLRDILIRELEDALEEWGTPFTFPAADEVTNHKDVLIEAVHALQQRYPDHGVLLVVDELLDYLGGREQRSLILDLGFLRELGEVAALTPFRFLAGLQESLFDNPRFSFVAQQLRRVRDRFEQVRIAREDIAYVVSERLLKKTDAQMARLIEHLRPFTPLYHTMAERIEEFARLFPIHPAYIETFERVYVAEKREVLKTFSLAVRSLLEQTVPTDQPGLISYDHYWNVLRDNPSMRGLPGVSEVVEKSNILEGRINNAYSRKHLLPLAQRIIHALSVHRLTTNDIHTPLGVTPEELRDTLTLYTRMPVPSPEMLLDLVQVALKEIMRTVSGQYISFNDANGQYYLDVKKDIDFDAKIQERGEFMEDRDLNRYFHDALRLVLNLSDTTYTTAGQIWLFELVWGTHKVTRPGYLFFGAPDERTTAQPPRDFYVYILPPFSPREYTDERRADEVIFQLTGLDQNFKAIVERYAGARALANEAPSHRGIYADEAEKVLRRRLVPWMRENLPTLLQVTHQGVTQPVRVVLTQTRSSAHQGLEELLHLVAAHLLEPYWDEAYASYPIFERASQPISEEARSHSAMDAIRSLAGRGRTQLATAVLEGLQLVDQAGNVKPYDSPYAQHYLKKLQNKPENQVVNQGEIIELVAEGILPLYKDIHFRLEPEWVVVTLLALVYHGDLVLNLDGRTALDAGNLDAAATKAMSALVSFRYYSRPRTLPLNLWAIIFDGLDIQSGLVRDETTRKEAVIKLGETVQAELEKTARLQGKLQSGLRLWNTPVFTDRLDYSIDRGTVIPEGERPAVTLSITELLPKLRGYKQFLEALTRFNTIGKLRNLRLPLAEIQDALEDRQVVMQAETLLTLSRDLQELTTYLAEAQANLPEDHPWSERAAAARTALLHDVRHLGRGEDARNEVTIRRELETLKTDYIQAYAALHRALVLGSQADERRTRLYRDPRLDALKTLAGVELLKQNAEVLQAWKKAITGLPICREFHEGVLQDAPTCPYCNLRPAQRRGNTASEAMLDNLDQRLDDMLLRWQQALRGALTGEDAQHSLKSMNPAERVPVEEFLAQDDDNPHIPAGFVVSANRALRGIAALTLAVDDLLAALREGGLPCTEAELQSRFTRFVRAAMRGHDARNTRLTLDQ